MTPLELDAQRRRWTEFRKRYEVIGQDKSPAALVPVSSDVAARMVVLPSDPLLHVIEFDDAFWEFWKTPQLHPGTGDALTWGSDVAPSAEGAVIGYRESRDSWKRYIAVFHSGVIEGLLVGNSAAYSFRNGMANEVVAFRLSAIVSRLWHVLSAYTALLARYEVQGPWELCVILTDTANSTLGNFAEGWSRPESGEWDLKICERDELVFRRELQSWPDDKEIKDLTFSVGSQIENAYGYTHRRFLKRDGSLDVTCLRWPLG